VHARNAIAQRGWGPLNYYLLDHAEVRKTSNFHASINHEQDSNSTSTLTIDICSSLNTTKGFAGDIMGKIVSEHMKDNSRAVTLNERKRKMNEAKNDFEKLKLLTRISSGSLAGVGCYHITSDIKDIVMEDRIAKKKREEEQNMKRKKRKEMDSENYLESKSKWRNKQQLTVKDLKLLLKHHCQPNDSPISSKAQDLREQFKKREYRLFDDLTINDALANDNRQNNNNNDEHSINALRLFTPCSENNNYNDVSDRDHIHEL
jgi:hypothetical protein